MPLPMFLKMSHAWRKKLLNYLKTSTLVLLGALDKKVGENSRKIDMLDRKIDGVVEDLKAHRKDTEAHPGMLAHNIGR